MLQGGAIGQNLSRDRPKGENYPRPALKCNTRLFKA